jgi:serine/threonine-protein kinase
MELIEGPTLADRIAQGPIPLDEALRIAKQIAAGLESAHEKPLTHRDLKPANVKIKPDGTVKVLDFGLAKLASEEVVPSSDSPTMMPETQAGVILGTAGYMSPEQARGQKADRRADIWAFGVVLYEMVTGKRLFDGATVSDSLAAILRAEPDLTQTPEKIRRLLARCLEKDPKDRLRDIGDWTLLLEETSGTGGSAPLRKGGWVAAVAVLAVIAGGLAFVHFRGAPAQAPLSARFQVDPPERFGGFFQISPDGRYLAMVAQRKLWIRPLGSL